MSFKDIKYLAIISLLLFIHINIFTIFWQNVGHKHTAKISENLKY